MLINKINIFDIYSVITMNMVLVYKNTVKVVIMVKLIFMFTFTPLYQQFGVFVLLFLSCCIIVVYIVMIMVIAIVIIIYYIYKDLPIF